jgi:hypothetical protein
VSGLGEPMTHTRDDRRAAARERAETASRYQPAKVNLLLVADSPPKSLDRYFYFEDVQVQDSLFRYIVRLVLGIEPARVQKATQLRALRDAGVFLVDLRPDPFDRRPDSALVRGLLDRVRALRPRCVVLIKANVFDAAYEVLTSAGIPVAPYRIPFPGSGQQKRFEERMAKALRWCAAMVSEGQAGEKP